jgi:hypothetical protein
MIPDTISAVKIRTPISAIPKKIAIHFQRLFMTGSSRLTAFLSSALVDRKQLLASLFYQSRKTTIGVA